MGQPDIRRHICQSLIVWLISTAIFVFGSWPLHSWAASSFWAQAEVGFSTTILYAGVSFWLARRVLRIMYTTATYLQNSLATEQDRQQEYRILYETVLRQAQELALLGQVRTALAQELDLQMLFRTVVEAIPTTFGYTQVSLYLVHDDTLVLQHQVGYERMITHIPIGQGVSGRVARTGQAVLLEDVHADPAFLGAIDGIVSEICVPLYHHNAVVGVLNVESTRGVRLTTADLRLMDALAEHISMAIGRAQLYQRVRESEERYRSVVAVLAEGVMVLDANGYILACNASAERILGLPAERLLGQTSLDPRWGAIHEDGTPFPGEQHPVMVTLRTGVPQRNVVMGLPQPDGSVTWIAINTQLLDYPGDTTPYTVVTSFSDITERKQLEAALREQALRDSLTGVFNRRYLEQALKQEVQRASRHALPLSVIMLDIDHFKRFNDTYGHAAGDMLLRAVGAGLQSHTRGEDLVCRYGGEEFILILAGASLREAERRAEEIRSTVQALNVQHNGQPLRAITVSLGVATYPQHGTDIAAVIQAADAALYQAKQAGRNRVVIAADNNEEKR